jgi:hypothetical protein
MPKLIKDPSKLYDAHDVELTPGCEVTVKAIYMDIGKTEAGADCRIRLVSTASGYTPIIAAHSSQLEKVVSTE